MKSNLISIPILFLLCAMAAYGQNIQGKVYDKRHLKGIASAKITLFQDNHSERNHTLTNSQGWYDLGPADQKYYRIQASAPGYNKADVVLQNLKANTAILVDFGLDELENPEILNPKVLEDFLSTKELKPIYFDFDKSSIREDAAIQLAQVVEILKAHPKTQISILSYTDSRGNQAYNQKLSARRAQATVNWIVNQGIESSRVNGNGRGENQLVNACADGVPCTQKQHQENRRSEYIITVM